MTQDELVENIPVFEIGPRKGQPRNDALREIYRMLKIIQI